MRTNAFTILLAVCYLTLFSGLAVAQSFPVKARFEVNGKVSKKRFRVLIYANGAPIEPTVSEDGQFCVPDLSVEQVDVRLISGRYDLLHEGVYLKKLRGQLVFGVKNHPSQDLAIGVRVPARQLSYKRTREGRL